MILKINFPIEKMNGISPPKLNCSTLSSDSEPEAGAHEGASNEYITINKLSILVILFIK